MAVEDSSSEEDIFTKGGVRGHMSMYAQLASSANNRIQDSEDDDDNDDSDNDDDNFMGLRDRQTRKRGRPKGRLPGGADKNAKKKNKGKKRMRSKDGAPGSDNSDVVAVGGNVYNVDSDEDMSAHCARDASDTQVARILAESRNAMMLMDENRILADAKRDAMAATEREERAERESLQERTRHQAAQKEMERKAAQAKTGPPIVLKVRCGDYVTKVRTKTTSPLLDMLPRFCEKFGLDKAKAVVQIDGETVTAKESASDYDLEENMVVDVFIR